MKKRINIGVMGCAAIAERSFIPAILSLSEDYRLVAVASRTSDKAADFAQKFHCEGITGYQNLIDRTDIDAIYLPLPTGLHAQWVMKALAAGKHVYAEKSIALNHQDASAMVQMAKAHEVALMEGYMFQYHKQQQHVRELLSAGAIGELRHFSATFGFPPLPPGDFRYDEQIGGGVLADAAGYPVRAAFFWLGDDITVQGASLFRDPASEVPLYGSAYLAGPNGVGASLAFGFDNYYQCRVTFWGSAGKLTMQKAFTPKKGETPGLMLDKASGTDIIHSEADDHFIGALSEFKTLIGGKERERHYKEILQQSEALEKIRNLARCQIAQ